MTTPTEFPPPPTANRKVFISYAREDRGSLEEIREGISALHHESWIDSNLDGGQAWWDVILEQIRRCDAMVLVVSPSLLESEAAARERDYARQLGKPLIPLVVAAVRSDLLPPDIATLQLIDYTRHTPLTGVQFANALSSVRTGVPLPEPLPEPPAVPVSYLGEVSNVVLLKRTLSADEQFSIAAKLAASLARPREHDAAAELLRRLEDRPDLFHQTAKEIERIWQEEAQRKGARAPSPETAREAVVGRAQGTPRPEPPLTPPRNTGAASGHQQEQAPQLVQSGPYPGVPAQHWGLSIVALLLFLPLGAAALYFASQVAKRWGAGNPAGALDASKKARLWGWVGIVIGAFWYLVLYGSTHTTPY
ncbi:TIR domain-containing protein [Specibacter cremeus]|uniref:TIR domain-containing protein n=1 Tax=Specibacter cremeus TaxID=1629051 RepID=UPI0013DE404F|nr:TIR domain-containing protein [Specibacter cremeus]